MIQAAPLLKEILISLLLIAGPIAFLGSVLIGVYFSLPITQRERARVFIDLLELGLRNGQSPEHTVLALSAIKDPTLGKGLHSLAAHIRNGLPLGLALTKVPSFLPRQVTAILQTAQASGVFRQALPLSRRILNDAKSETNAGLTISSPSMAALPFVPALLVILALFVFPKFIEISDAMDVSVPAVAQIVFDHTGVFLLPTILVAFTIFLLWLSESLPVAPSMEDKIHRLLPWRQTRLKRNFGVMLGLLLDAGVPEAIAIENAGKSTGSTSFARHAQKIEADLKRGVKLPEAVRRLDAGEFQWRLQNAAHDQQGFSHALNGWLEGLDAKAFQQEQTAMHLATSALLLVNGTIVGFFAVGMFQVLIGIMNEAVLW